MIDTTWDTIDVSDVTFREGISKMVASFERLDAVFGDDAAHPRLDLFFEHLEKYTTTFKAVNGCTADAEPFIDLSETIDDARKMAGTAIRVLNVSHHVASRIRKEGTPEQRILLETFVIWAEDAATDLERLIWMRLTTGGSESPP